MCQSVKESCDLFIEPQLTSFLVLCNFPYVHIIQYDDIRYQKNPESIARC